jgi:hypothetical protein
VDSLYDARTGSHLGTINPDYGNLIALAFARDGSAVATPNKFGTVSVWDIPPRKPGGIVLALMIGEVGLLTAWTAYRRRRRRTRPATM